MEDLPQGSGGIRLPIDAAQVKGVPAPKTVFTDNTLHSTTSTTPVLIHSINLPTDRVYNLGARFSVYSGNAGFTTYVKFSLQVRTVFSQKSFDSPVASTTSSTPTTLQIELDATPLFPLCFATVVQLYLWTNAGSYPAYSQREELLADTGKLVGD